MYPALDGMRMSGKNVVTMTFANSFSENKSQGFISVSSLGTKR
jgi:hypothetical protein